jgi:hypothetical protein
MAEQQPAMTEADAEQWVRAHYQAAAKYLAEEGYILDMVHLKDSRYLAPYVAVWRFTTTNKQDVWIINGDVPTDMVAAKVANDARSVMRHFALQWQLKAQAIEDKAKAEEQDYAKYLIGRAEMVYQTTDHESLWNNN